MNYYCLWIKKIWLGGCNPNYCYDCALLCNYELFLFIYIFCSFVYMIYLFSKDTFKTNFWRRLGIGTTEYIFFIIDLFCINMELSYQNGILFCFHIVRKKRKDKYFLKYFSIKVLSFLLLYTEMFSWDHITFVSYFSFSKKTFKKLYQ